jgi:flagella basal body P-ring formation protein FlgA
MNPLRLLPLVIAGLVTLAAPVSARPDHTGDADLVSATEAVRRAIVARTNADAEVTVGTLDVKGDAPLFREARPDPAGRFGGPIRFTLITGAGGGFPATATVRVIADHVVLRQPVARGAAVPAEALQTVRAELTGMPLTRLPAMTDIVGARALRPLVAGDIVLATFVAARRVVEAGDRVKVVVLSGAVEVSAEFIAADGGAVGDTIRIRNPETKKFVRGRILKSGLVEVLYER